MHQPFIQVNMRYFSEVSYASPLPRRVEIIKSTTENFNCLQNSPLEPEYSIYMKDIVNSISPKSTF